MVWPRTEPVMPTEVATETLAGPPTSWNSTCGGTMTVSPTPASTSLIVTRPSRSMLFARTFRVMPDRFHERLAERDLEPLRPAHGHVFR